MEANMKIVLSIVALSLMALSGCVWITDEDSAESVLSEEGCYRGTLHERYCDRDRDLVADPPLDENDWINPNTIIFSYTPVKESEFYAGVWEGFLSHMAEVTGRDVSYLPVSSYEDQYAAMRAGHLHVAGVNTGGNPIAVSCAGMVPFAIMASEDGSYGHEMEIIVPKGSDIKSPWDIYGRTLALTSPVSNSGNKAPTTLLRSEFDLVRNQNFKTIFSGTHSSSIIGVAEKKYEVAAVSNAVLKRMIDRKMIEPESVVSIYKSATFPTTSYGHVYNLHPKLAAKIKKAFFTFDWEGSELQKEFKNEGRFVSIHYKSDWSVIRRIDSANGVSYDCE